MSPKSTDSSAFGGLGLSEPVLRALEDAGYAEPTPIQAQTIPVLAEGRDVLGQAQTGTGKTAAFTLPILSRLECGGRSPKVLILLPTRELAIQVAKNVETYGAHMRGLRVTCVYGGADYRPQLQALRRGVDVLVGTPGRLMDHMRKGAVDVSGLECMVLDEADEMLKMGFIDDVEWILSHTPDARQTALFSATMPAPIRKLSAKFMRDPEHVTIKTDTATAANIRQRYYYARGRDKLEILGRMLAAEDSDGVLVFVRTRNATTLVAEGLRALGHTTAALSGDVSQSMRERTVESLRRGSLKIIVATDVAARGLDVSRISHVINFDMPENPEVYVHRIGRTGRAGRAGDAILFLTPREEHKLRAIQRTTRHTMERFVFPSLAEMNAKRIDTFKETLTKALEAEKLDAYEAAIAEVVEATGVSPLRAAAALARQGSGEDLLLPERLQKKDKPTRDRNERGERHEGRERPWRKESRGDSRRGGRRDGGRPNRDREAVPSEPGMERYRIEAGSEHGVEPRGIVGAIANEAGLQGKDIGRIVIFEDHSLVDLPEGMPRPMLRHLKRVWLGQRQLRLSPISEVRGQERGDHDPRGTDHRSARPHPKAKRDGKKFAKKKFEGKKFEGKKFAGKKSGGKKFPGKKFTSQKARQAG